MIYLETQWKFEDLKYILDSRMVHQGETVDVGQWQSIDVSGKPEMVTRELTNVSLSFGWLVRDWDVEGMQQLIPANQPWAETHFQERVGGEPVNPPPSHQLWPYAQQDNQQWRKQGFQFSHTYPERMWPKKAGYFTDDTGMGINAHGIRWQYGDLLDVMSLLVDHPYTRQAYLPIWFPEDTGVVHGERVPCTLGYHFMIRGGLLSVTYYMRSCDLRRHFTDDVYLAARLAQWISHSISEKLWERHRISVNASLLNMHIASLHIFEGDWEFMRDEVKKEAMTRELDKTLKLQQRLGSAF